MGPIWGANPGYPPRWWGGGAREEALLNPYSCGGEKSFRRTILTPARSLHKTNLRAFRLLFGIKNERSYDYWPCSHTRAVLRLP